MRKTLGRGDWPTVADFFLTLRSHRERDFWFSALPNGKASQLKSIERWTEEDPSSGVAWILRASKEIELGWKARGGGFGDTVSMKAAESLEHHLMRADDCLNRAASLLPNDPQIYTQWLVVGKGLSFPPDRLRELFERAMACDPTHFGALSQRFDCLTRKWHGSEKEMFEFVRETAGRLDPGEPGLALVVEAHREAWLDFDLEEEGHDSDEEATEDSPGDEPGARIHPYFLRPEVHEEIVTTYQRWAEAEPLVDDAYTLIARNNFAWGLHKVGEFALALRELNKIGDKATDIWFSKWGFRRALKRSAKYAAQQRRARAGVPA
ncbi:MAG: hypothetical protein AAF517_20695 [Planctomycetota bacterium]